MGEHGHLAPSATPEKQTTLQQLEKLPVSGQVLGGRVLRKRPGGVPNTQGY